MSDVNAAQAGDALPKLTFGPVSRTTLALYAGASGDHNPIHIDTDYAKEAGMKDVFAHGMLSMGLTGKMLTNYVGDGRLTKYGVRFTNQVWPGDTLTATATVTDIRSEGSEQFVDLTLETKNQDGKTVITGSATARIDP